MPDFSFRMHHVGVVVDQLADAAKEISRVFSLQATTPVYEDPIQQVRVQFWGTAADVTQIELIEPLGPRSPSAGALRKGGGLNHVCYEVIDVNAAFAYAISQGAVPVASPVPAVAFSGRSIAFVFVRGLGLVEFVEAVKE